MQTNGGNVDTAQTLGTEYEPEMLLDAIKLAERPDGVVLCAAVAAKADGTRSCLRRAPSMQCAFVQTARPLNCNLLEARNQWSESAPVIRSMYSSGVSIGLFQHGRWL